MKSLYFEKYGSWDVLSFRDLPKPKLEPGRVLVKVQAAAVNPLDWRLVRADPFIVRLGLGFFKPKHKFLGADFSGVVDSVADDVSSLQSGDPVFGLMTPEVVGAFAEYISIPAEAVVRKPASLTHQQASALPVAGLTAYEGIHDYYTIESGDRVLINGASGGIGTFAVQMAKSLGAHVTAVCSAGNHELVRSLGADAVIDYKATDITQLNEPYDLVFDLIGTHPPKALKRLLTNGGRLVLASAGDSWGFLRAMKLAGKDPSIELIMDLKKGAPRLQALAELCENGKMAPVIDREYPFEEVIDAVKYVATKRARGKVIVNIAK